MQTHTLWHGTHFKETIGPAILDAVAGPDIVSVLSQQLHKLLQLFTQSHSGQVQWTGLVAVCLQVAAKHQMDNSYATQ